MNPLTLEWIAKAEGDYATDSREFRVRMAPNYDAVCFHCQQTAEKYLKAWLQENAQDIPKTHDLLELLALCIKSDPSLVVLQDLLNILEAYAIQYRYPGYAAEKPEAKAAMHAASLIRLELRNRLIP